MTDRDFISIGSTYKSELSTASNALLGGANIVKNIYKLQ